MGRKNSISVSHSTPMKLAPTRNFFPNSRFPYDLWHWEGHNLLHGDRHKLNAHHELLKELCHQRTTKRIDLSRLEPQF